MNTDLFALNISKELLKVMERLEFKPKALTRVRKDPKFIDSLDKNEQIQRSMLTMLFYDITMYGDKRLPNDIRIAMNLANEPRHWLDDMTTTVLPFMKVNEDYFFN